MTFHEKNPQSLSWADKTKAFFKGALSGKPLVEIAVTGLRTPYMPEYHQLRYARKAAPHISAEIAFDILQTGSVTSAEALDILASVVRRGGDLEHAYKLLFCDHIESHRLQIVMAKWIHESARHAENLSSFGTNAYILLMIETVDSHHAQEVLAEIVRDAGLSERAAELLMRRNPLSPSAQLRLVHALPEERSTIVKVFLRGSVTCPHSVAELLSKMPPICTPIEEKQADDAE